MSNLIEHLKLREGVIYKSYKDSLGYLTGGVGHLLTEEEKALYPEGSPIPSEVVDTWLVADVALSKKAAQKQAEELLEPSQKLIDALVHVNFQLGTSWYKIHKKTWAYMLQGNYEEAAKEAANSKWYTQTPVRVKDFQEALLKESERRKEVKEKLIVVAKQKTTWIGIAALIGAAIGLPTGSEEQVAVLLAGIVGVIYPEKPKAQ